jgi:hypothetical protein
MNDALERLKNRQRPVVPPRDFSLDSEQADISTFVNQDIQKSSSVDTLTSEYQNIKESSLVSEKLALQEAQEIKIPKTLTTKQTTIRLEAKLLERVAKLCAKENLSREVLFEALFEHYEQDGEAWAEILSQAKQKAEVRLAIANRKRAKTMMQRFSP